MSTESVTVGIVNYNGGLLVGECLRSVFSQDYPRLTAVVVDNGSTDDSPDLLRKAFPQVDVVRFARNGGPPLARNWIIRHATTRLVLCLDNDVVLEPDCLSQLVGAMASLDSVAVCGPRVMDYRRRDRPQLGVTYIHYTGAVVVRQVNAAGPVEVGSVGGGAILIDRDKALRAGLYDEDYFFGLEDNDFCTQQRLAGYRCLHVPDARIYHQGKERGLWAAFYQVRNRWFFLLKFYRPRTLIAIAPALLIYEFFTLAFLTASGRLGDYLRALADLWRHLGTLLEKRRHIQAQRRVPDRDILQVGEIYLRPEMMVRRYVGLARRIQSCLFGLYWRMAGKLI